MIKLSLVLNEIQTLVILLIQKALRSVGQKTCFEIYELKITCRALLPF